MRSIDSPYQETVTQVHHWNDTLFSFKTTRNHGFRFENGHFVMLGLADADRPLMRAYSIASANYQEEMEFFSIKVPDGPLTSKLQKIAVGDQVIISRKPTGTLLVSNLRAGKHLYLLSTGTGLAPFLSIIRDPEVYEKFEKVILVHGVRYISELAYQDLIQFQLPNDEYLGEMVRDKLIYYPTVTRENYTHQGRITHLMASKKLFDDIQLPAPNLEDDRFMLCGSPAMLKDLTTLLTANGFRESKRGEQHEYVIERAFVEK
ncbi:MAG TPA: ferredoxin--NADP(+) reductase [Gammaproteobacteria bacterium]|nr:ferredoxin--NADP(+) reductase [Gammaproteobacteria bacterium]